MPRLPIPGKDEGTWGDVLNDYLSASHDAEGVLKPGSVGTSQLQDKSISSAHLQDNSITNNQLAPGSVTSASIAANAVTSAALADNSISSAQLADGAVSASAIADGSITETLLASEVKTKLNTPATIASGSLTEDKLHDDVKTKLNAPATIDDGSVAKAKLDAAVQSSLDKADSALQTAPVTKVNNKTGEVSLNKADLGLGSVDNTADVDKPVSSAVQVALDGKVGVANLDTQVATIVDTKGSATQEAIMAMSNYGLYAYDMDAGTYSPDRTGTAPAIFVGPLDPNTLDLMATGDIWIDTEPEIEEPAVSSVGIKKTTSTLSVPAGQTAYVTFHETIRSSGTSLSAVLANNTVQVSEPGLYLVEGEAATTGGGADPIISVRIRIDATSVVGTIASKAAYGYWRGDLSRTLTLTSGQRVGMAVTNNSSAAIDVVEASLTVTRIGAI